MIRPARPGQGEDGRPRDALVDSHCHLTDPRFSEDRDEVVDRAVAAGVTRMVAISSSAADAEAVLALAAERSEVWATVGIHPHEVGAADDGDLGRLRELVARPGVVAVGETGLDFHYDNAPRDQQIRWFERHAELAEAVGLPLVVHARSADADVAAVVRSVGPRVRGVLHCFTGGSELFEVAMAAGWYLGFGGIATFSSFAGLDALTGVPSDRLLLETDAPYLAPVPHRGRRNEPAYLVHSLSRVAELLDEAADVTAARTSENAERLFRLKGGTEGG